jgi:hypothetical protein
MPNTSEIAINTVAPKNSAKNILIDFATKACKDMGGAAEIGNSGYWIVDSKVYEIVRKK